MKIIDKFLANRRARQKHTKIVEADAELNNARTMMEDAISAWPDRKQAIYDLCYLIATENTSEENYDTSAYFNKFAEDQRRAEISDT